jgi:hypothetical protein
MLSNEGVKDAIEGAEVEQKVTDCLQDWSAAGGKAVQEMMEKQRQQDAAEAAEAARVQFVISLIGNLAWAATVFFPPTTALVFAHTFSEIEGVATHTTPLKEFSASAATKIVSVLGAAVGSGTIAQFTQANGSLDWIAVQDHLDELVPQIAKSLASVAQQWTDGYLANHMVKTFSTRKNLRTDHNDDREFKEWVRTYEGGQELRRTVWEKFVFPIPGLEFDRREAGLKKFLVEKLTTLKTNYDRQYKDYVQQRTYAYWSYFQQSGGYTGSPMLFRDWNRIRGNLFHFVASLDGLPAEFLKAQDRRLRDMEFRLASGDTRNRIPTPQPAPPPRMRPWGS